MRQDPSLGQAAALHACAVEQLKQRNEEAERSGQPSLSSIPSSISSIPTSISSKPTSNDSSRGSGSSSSSSGEGRGEGGDGQQLQLNASDETGAELQEAGMSLTATSDTQVRAWAALVHLPVCVRVSERHEAGMSFTVTSGMQVSFKCWASQSSSEGHIEAKAPR